uniref:Uncharacterized protein n=1 Tax=Cacopsylla melanoneura TaxID=428564 RepID=A0A8D9E4Z8_9HEMI
MSSTHLAIILACLTVYSRVKCDPTFDILHPQGNANNLAKRDTSVKDLNQNVENIHSLVRRDVNGDLMRRIVIEMDEIKSLSRRDEDRGSDHTIFKRSLDKKVNIRGQRVKRMFSTAGGR